MEKGGNILVNIILWGTGAGSKRMTEYIKKNSEIFDVSILAYTDNDSEKWNSEFLGAPVISPIDIKKYDYDYVEIASVKCNEIKKQCIQELQLPKEKIKMRGELFREYYVQYQYKKRYNDAETGLVNKKIDRLVVYTANFGNYDVVKEPLFVDDGIRYVCFTDDKEFASNIWDVCYIDTSQNEDFALAVRYYKFFPYRLFPDYDVSVWIDSKFQITGDLRTYIEKYQRESSMLCFPHFERDCIFDEAAECLHLGKGDPIMLGGQIYQYYMENYPKHNGLYECGCLVRWHEDIKMQKIMEEWWEEICKFSRRDQVSLPYISWKNDYCIDISDLNIKKNSFFKEIGHIN